MGPSQKKNAIGHVIPIGRGFTEEKGMLQQQERGSAHRRKGGNVYKSHVS